MDYMQYLGCTAVLQRHLSNCSQLFDVNANYVQKMDTHNQILGHYRVK